MSSEDMMLTNLSQVLEEEREARRTAQEENERLQTEADRKKRREPCLVAGVVGCC